MQREYVLAAFLLYFARIRDLGVLEVAMFAIKRGQNYLTKFGYLCQQ